MHSAKLLHGETETDSNLQKPTIARIEYTLCSHFTFLISHFLCNIADDSGFLFFLCVFLSLLSFFHYTYLLASPYSVVAYTGTLYFLFDAHILHYSNLLQFFDVDISFATIISFVPIFIFLQYRIIHFHHFRKKWSQFIIEKFRRSPTTDQGSIYQLDIFSTSSTLINSSPLCTQLTLSNRVPNGNHATYGFIIVFIARPFQLSRSFFAN